MAEKKKSGRPLEFQGTAEEMQKCFDEYYKSCEPQVYKDSDGYIVTDKNGKPVIITERRALTVEGLANSIGVSDDTLNRYQDRDEFCGTITRAKMKIKQQHAEMLFSNESYKGAAFCLENNYGYKNKQDITIDGGISITLTGSSKEYAK